MAKKQINILKYNKKGRDCQNDLRSKTQKRCISNIKTQVRIFLNGK